MTFVQLIKQSQMRAQDLIREKIHYAVIYLQSTMPYIQQQH